MSRWVNSRWALPALCAAVFAVAAGAYANTLGCGFVYDDQFAILSNEVVTDPGRIKEVFTTSYWGSLAPETSTTGYRPLTILSYHLNYRLARENAATFHAVNVAMHGLVCVLVLVFVARLTREVWLALVSAGIFSLHAIHTEAVASIVGRAELGAALGVLAALILHVEAARARERGGHGWLAWSAGAAVATFSGLLFKETALCVPLLALSADWWARRKVAVVGPLYVGHLVAIGGFLGLRLWMFGELSPATGTQFVDNPMVELSLWQRIPACAITLGKAALMILFPAQLSSDYAYAQLPLDAPLTRGLFWVGVVAVACAGYLAWRFRGTQRLVPAALVMMASAYAPVSNLPMVIHTIFGERTLYLASLGACILIALVAVRLVASGSEKARVATIAALSLYMVFHAARTTTRNRDWKSDYTLTTADIRVCPRSVRLLNNHGNELMSRGRIPEACNQLRKAVEITGEVPTINGNLGLCLLKLGKVDEAIAIFEDVLEKEPESSVALRHLPIAREMKEEMQSSSGSGPSTSGSHDEHD